MSTVTSCHYIEKGPFQIGVQTKKNQVGQAKKLIEKQLAEFIEKWSQHQ